MEATISCEIATKWLKKYAYVDIFRMALIWNFQVKNSHGFGIILKDPQRTKNLSLENSELFTVGLTAVSCEKDTLVYALNDLE